MEEKADRSLQYSGIAHIARSDGKMCDALSGIFL